MEEGAMVTWLWSSKVLKNSKATWSRIPFSASSTDGDVDTEACSPSSVMVASTWVILACLSMSALKNCAAM